MSATLSSRDQRVVLSNVSWETYERLLRDLSDRSSPHLTYDRGVLEIMSPSPEHEEYNRNLNLLVEVMAEERGIDIRNLGSTTYKRYEFLRGFEPDSSFYIQNEGLMRGKMEIDLLLDPPPDLMIEIDVSRDSGNKLPLFEQFGVPEVWNYTSGKFRILILKDTGYSESLESLAFPGLLSTDIARLLQDSLNEKRTGWLRKMREWIRRQNWPKQAP